MWFSRMPRNGEKVRRRLQQAALELFGERGYEETTAANIAAKAGVTERTFFRHFADKRDVLFGGETELGDVLATAVRRTFGAWPLGCSVPRLPGGGVSFR
jgi:AcrR family transcriptional regulator